MSSNSYKDDAMFVGMCIGLIVGVCVGYVIGVFTL